MGLPACYGFPRFPSPFFAVVGQEIAFCGEEGGGKKREGENKMDDQGFFSLSPLLMARII